MIGYFLHYRSLCTLYKITFQVSSIKYFYIYTPTPESIQTWIDSPVYKKQFIIDNSMPIIPMHYTATKPSLDVLSALFVVVVWAVTMILSVSYCYKISSNNVFSKYFSLFPY